MERKSYYVEVSTMSIQRVRVNAYSETEAKIKAKVKAMVKAREGANVKIISVNGGS